MFKTILIANRGEIALRVIRTCREMGIRTIAVHSDADRDSLHVKYAHESINIGPPLARKSYLNVERIIEAAKKTGAEAIHPGYGFLAESAHFVEACDKNGIKFIGPRAETQRLTGEKISSRSVARRLGIPVSPGSESAIASDEEALETARRIGYPVIVKASGGGGGRGMKVAVNDRELLQVLKVSRGEAMAAFKNQDIYLERYLEGARHVEFQILGDEYGNYVHLGERECTIQKRYQKLLEESPSPVLDEGLRREMADAAIEIMRSVGYINAGTVEFLLDEDLNFYFNEINSRIQVEHPVTEMRTGIDIVREQLIIASGEKLEFKQDEISMKGWAIECRINAEDPENDFMPSPGRIDKIIFPGGIGVRIDTHLYPGYEIPPFYDSLVGKLIVWGENRTMTISRMKRALDEFCIEGIKTTIPFHRRIMEDPDFMAGSIDTRFIDRFFIFRS